MKITKLKAILFIITLSSTGSLFGQQNEPDSTVVAKDRTVAHNQIGIMQIQSFYGSNLPTMSMTSLQYLRKTNDEKATFIGRVNYRTRDGKNSLKYDAESYIKHGKSHYSFIGISLSDKKMFPGFEGYYSLYSSLKKGWELETGMKYLSATNFNLFTPIVGISKEMEYNRLTLRNFITFTSGNVYYGNAFTWKNFLNDSRDNISVMAGFGNAPDSKTLDFSENFVSNKSQFIGIGYEKNLKSFKISAATVYNRNHFSTGKKFNQYDVYLNAFYNF